MLDQHVNDLPNALRAWGQPTGLLRPLQLVALSLLERTGDVDSWLRRAAQRTPDGQKDQRVEQGQPQAKAHAASTAGSTVSRNSYPPGLTVWMTRRAPSASSSWRRRRKVTCTTFA